MPVRDVFLHGITTEVPQYRIPQERILQFMLEHLVLCDRERGFLEKIYRGSAISYRHSVIPDFGDGPASFFPEGPGLTPEPSTATRNMIFTREAEILTHRAAASVCGEVGLDPGAVTHLVTASCTGFSAPGFDLSLIKRIPLNPAISRYHLGFMGCFAAIPALRLANTICRAEPGAVVMVVNAELCTLHFRNTLDPDAFIANCLFADGVSAAIVSADESISKGVKARLGDFSSTVIPDSSDQMSWIIGDHGFNMKLSSYVPRLLRSHLRPIIDSLLLSYGLAPHKIPNWAIHPGGRAILDRVAEALEMPAHALDDSYAVLKDFGNMSSATVMFVLRRMLQNGANGNLVTAAFGPGLTVESALMEIA